MKSKVVVEEQISEEAIALTKPPWGIKNTFLSGKKSWSSQNVKTRKKAKGEKG